MKTNLVKLFLLSGVTFLVAGRNETRKLNDESGKLTLKSRAFTYKGLVMAGYHGWFNTEGDGADRGWNHYKKNQLFEPGNCKIDFWPEMTEYGKQYPTTFYYADETRATLLSSYDESTVDLHFKWMKAYGIDGAFVQRFVTNLKNQTSYHHNQKVLVSAFKASVKYGRIVRIMYELSGITAGEETILTEDWKQLVDQYNLKNDSCPDRYLYHNGKPLVVVWGAGFNDNRKYELVNVKTIVDFLKSDPHYGGFSVWCKQHHLDYVPTDFPGFSWHNMYPEYPSNQIPRNKRGFFWKQISGALSLGAEMIYVAMFDEIDEGTAIFKCAHDVPSDYYLWLTGQAGKILRKEIPLLTEIPVYDHQNPK